MLLFISCESSNVRKGREAYKKYFQEVLNDPKSLDILSEKYERIDLCVYWVIDYTAKNKIGGTVRATDYFLTIDDFLKSFESKEEYLESLLKERNAAEEEEEAPAPLIEKTLEERLAEGRDAYKESYETLLTDERKSLIIHSEKYELSGDDIYWEIDYTAENKEGNTETSTDYFVTYPIKDVGVTSRHFTSKEKFIEILNKQKKAVAEQSVTLIYKPL